MLKSEPQHLKASAQALKLLDTHGITYPHEIRVEDIAWKLDIEINVKALKSAEHWLAERRAHWERRLDALGDYLCEADGKDA